MHKALNTVLFSLCFGAIKSQTTYQITISNLSKNPFEINVNQTDSKNVLHLQTLTIVDSTGFEPFALIKVKIIIVKQASQQVHEIQFVTEDNSKINLEVNNVDSIKNGKGFKISGSPFPEKQEVLINGYFKKKNEFTEWVRKEYVKTHDRTLSRLQSDSILNVVRRGRREYLSSIAKFIYNQKDSYIAFPVFKSEFMAPKSILAIGKEKVISIFELLDTSYYQTEIGKLTKNYIQNLKSNSVGAQIKNFRFKTEDFKEYNLHHIIKNSKALLIFTARGCKACIEQIPIIKEIERAYQSDMKILYVSLDPTVDVWKKNMETSHYPGLITLNIPPYNYSTDLEQLFMVSFIPQLFLIDENLTILYDNLSPFEDEKLTRLKKLLNIVSE